MIDERCGGVHIIYHGRQNNDLLRTGHRGVCVSLVEIVEDRGQRTEDPVAYRAVPCRPLLHE